MSVRFPEVYGTISCMAVGACLIYQSDPRPGIKDAPVPPPLFHQPSSLSSLHFPARANVVPQASGGSTKPPAGPWSALKDTT